MIPPVIRPRHRTSAPRTAITDIPPPRYRVIERNRRLDVVDTRPPTDPRPRNGSMLEGRAPPRTALPPAAGSTSTKLVLLWSAIILASIVAVTAIAWGGMGALIVLAVIAGSLYKQNKPAIDRWVASLD